MTSQPPDIQALLERLDRLERQSRLKGVALVFLILPATGLLLSLAPQTSRQQAAARKEVAAQRFVLQNAAGETRAELALIGGEPSLGLNAPTGGGE